MASFILNKCASGIARARTHTRVPHSSLYTLRYPLALITCFDSSLHIFLTHRVYPFLSIRARPALPASFVPRPPFNRCEELPPTSSTLSVQRIHFDFLTSSTLSLRSHRQFRASLYRARALRRCSFYNSATFPPPSRPRNDAFISPYPHRCHIARACLPPPAELVVLYYSAVRIICPDASRSSLYHEVARPLRPAAFASFRYARGSLHHSLRLRLSLSRTSIRPSDRVSSPPAFPCLRRVSSRSTFRHAGLFAPVLLLPLGYFIRPCHPPTSVTPR